MGTKTIHITHIVGGDITITTGGSTPEVYSGALTRFTFADGTVEEYDIQGDWTDQVNVKLGLQDGETWLWKGEIVRVDVGTNVTSMGDYCLYDTDTRESPYVGLANLTTVTIPSTVTSIGESAFWGCIGLTSVTIPNSVESIGANAFYNCSGLTSVTIPDSVTSIGSYAFYGCSVLMSFSVGINNLNYSSVNGLLLSKDGRTLIQGVNGDVTIPSSVTNIGDSAFYNCSGLTSVTIPDSVTSIGGNAFYGCSRLTNVTIPDGVTSIGSSAFSYCTGLTSVTILDGVTSIGSTAFYGCNSLASVVFKGKTLAQVQGMTNYPWGIGDTSIITVA